MRRFRDQTCPAFNTVELPREVDARVRREARKTATSSGATTVPVPIPDASAARPRTLNLNTYKFHSLGDYVQTIRRFGTTDSYSTQLGETAHCAVKRYYSTTNKRDAIKQIAKKRARSTVFREEKKEMGELAKATYDHHHVIASTRNHPIDIFRFVEENQDDPACTRDFIPKLQDHLLGRLLGRTFDGDDHDFTPDELNSIRLVNWRMYASQVLRVNYTTYDVRRNYDTTSATRRTFVMLRSPEAIEDTSAHPYWYAQVLGVFRADVAHIGQHSRSGPKPREMEFLWVRWLGIVPDHQYGHIHARLPKVGYVPSSDDYAFGFLDPALVLRASHLVPSFVDGRTSELLREGPSYARRGTDVDDWTSFYVNM
ncbi:uncharacterized protein SCHCODRAFT_02495166 [Schizophyllum commune H4-8]|uniref:uncharacterized protein n=1 Tax=Schizophyllum commune (strain H4-8 / FGSC 9210) TaxID=578458 RepID=UPI00215E6E40|nr:uncharacterized protein SCHCODRAFT_02495166 [Schizophyllum commune H4-8]KAI5894786.1 hypothetical protein SCHCODRAFT_02495166 [Schizophyllum commune H4-8]